MVVASGSEPEGRRFDSCPRCLTEVTRTGEEAVLKTAGRKTCGFESHGLRLIKQHIVLWPSGEGTCLTYRGSTVRIRPGLLFIHRHQSAWRGRCLQNILSEFESRWCLCKELQRSKRHGPSVQSGVDATLSRWSDQPLVGARGSNPVWVAYLVRYANG